MSQRPGVTSFVHVGLVVEDLDETARPGPLVGMVATNDSAPTPISTSASPWP